MLSQDHSCFTVEQVRELCIVNIYQALATKGYARFLEEGMSMAIEQYKKMKEEIARQITNNDSHNTSTP
jgi:hypothetical protein